MENKSKYPEYTFFHAKAMMDNLYDLAIQEDDFIEKAFMVWQDIGNKFSNAHVIIGTVGPDNKLELPNNVDYIQAVTWPRNFQNYNFSNVLVFLNGSLLYNKSNIEWDSYKYDSSLMSRYGDYITFRLEDGYITFDSADFAGKDVAVLYHGLIVDNECNPKLYYTDVKAIAYNVAYMIMRGRVMQGDKNLAAMLQLIKQEADYSLTEARMPQIITDNEWDQILNIKTSFNRKYYNRAYKYSL